MRQGFRHVIWANGSTLSNLKVDIAHPSRVNRFVKKQKTALPRVIAGLTRNLSYHHL